MEELSLVARKFTIMRLFWFHDDKMFRTHIDEQYDPLQRFDTTENKIQGQLADLLEGLPPVYVELMSKGETAWLSQKVRLSFTILDFTCEELSQFRDAMMTQRSNTSTRVRKQAGPSIFACRAQDLEKPETRYEMFRERVGWVRRDSGDIYETWAVEVLHKDY